MRFSRFFSLRSELLAMLVMLLVGYLALAVTAFFFTANIFAYYKVQESVRGAYEEWLVLANRSQSIRASDKPLADSWRDFRAQEQKLAGILGTLMANPVDETVPQHREITNFYRGLMEAREQMSEISEWMEDLLLLPGTELPAATASFDELKNRLPDNPDSLTYSQFMIYKINEKLGGFEGVVGEYFETFRQRLHETIQTSLAASLRDYLIRGMLIVIGALFVVILLLVRIQTINLYLDRVIKERTQSLNDSLVELKQTQEAVIESRRQAAVTSMVVGLAHEMGTPLGVAITTQTAVSAWAGEFSHRFESGSLTRNQTEEFMRNVRQSMSLIESSLSRLSAQLSVFKTLAVDKEEYRLENMDLGIFVPVLMGRLESMTVKAGAAFSWDFDCTPGGTFRMSPLAVSWILTQLVENSIAHGLKSVDHPKVRVELKCRNGLKIMVKDNGNGMSDHVLEHVMEPFFTTSRTNGHMGIGLNIVHNLVTQVLRGAMEIRNGTPGLEVSLDIPDLSESDTVKP